MFQSRGIASALRFARILLGLCLSLVSCRLRTVDLASSNGTGPGSKAQESLAAGFESRARSLAAAMSDEELVGQALIVGVEGVQRLSNGSRSALELIQPGAVILFGFNVAEDPRQVAVLASEIRTAAGKNSAAYLPPFIAIDHEGGSVYRFKGGMTRLPAAKAMGRAGMSAARMAGAAAGSELRSIGVTMNAAPVVEALTDGNRAFLQDRVWSDEPGPAGKLASGFLEACQSSGAAAVAKHFPGNAEADPHRGLPVLSAARATLDTVYYAPFRDAIRSGVSSIMLSHVLVPAIDPDLPVSVSAVAIAVLKERLGFRGIVMTDDLQMAALAGIGGPEAAAVAALSAGADLLMVSGGRTALAVRTALLEALADGRISRARLEDAAARIIAQKLRFGLDTETADDRDRRLADFGAAVARNRIALSGAMTEQNASAYDPNRADAVPRLPWNLR
jgi:beta-N-acetylhexosaminidase